MNGGSSTKASSIVLVLLGAWVTLASPPAPAQSRAPFDPKDVPLLVPGTPVSLEDCLRKRAELAAEAKKAGDKAWDVIMRLPGAQFVSAEAHRLYALADQYRKAADKMRCLFQPDKGHQSSKDKAIDRAIEEIAKRALKDGPNAANALISDYIRKQLKVVETHKSHIMDRLAEVERGVASLPIDPSAQPEVRPNIRPPPPERRDPLAGLSCRGTRAGGTICASTGGDPGTLVRTDGMCDCRDIGGRRVSFCRGSAARDQSVDHVSCWR